MTDGLTLMLLAWLKLSASPRSAGYQESPAVAMRRIELHIHYKANIWNVGISKIMRYLRY